MGVLVLKSLEATRIVDDLMELTAMGSYRDAQRFRWLLKGISQIHGGRERYQWLLGHRTSKFGGRVIPLAENNSWHLAPSCLTGV